VIVRQNMCESVKMLESESDCTLFFEITDACPGTLFGTVYI
jgi:hypothetical protein